MLLNFYDGILLSIISRGKMLSEKLSEKSWILFGKYHVMLFFPLFPILLDLQFKD